MIRCLLAAALLVGTPTSASAQMKPSRPDAVADAVADCWGAVGPKTIDRAVLGQRGWKAGSISDAKGGQVDTPLQFYSKPGSNVVLMLMNEDNSPLCSIVSRVNSVADISLVAQSVQRRLTTADPQVATVRSGKNIVFLSLPKIAMLEGTGSKAQPSVRISVQFQNPEKK